MTSLPNRYLPTLMWRRLLAVTIAWLMGGVGLGSVAAMTVIAGCHSSKSKKKNKNKKADTKGAKGASTAKGSDKAAGAKSSKSASIIFLHHSTGENIHNGGVEAWFASYNDRHGTQYRYTERAYPNEPYPWNNYPYDYWNIWVKHAGSEPYNGQDTLEILTKSYDTIVFKHCFPVSAVEAGDGADVASEDKTLPNYKAQYQALKKKLRTFKDTRFIVWTGAALTRTAMSNDYGGNDAMAERASQFFHWVKSSWDEQGDNIFVFDFYDLETEGGRYLKDSNAQDAADPHPNEAFAKKIAPLFAQRVVNVIQGKGDSTSLTGR